MLATASDVNVIHWQNAIKEAQQRRQEEEGKANAVNEVSRKDPDLRRRLSRESSTALIAVVHAIKEEQQIGGGAGSLFGRPSPAQLLALAGGGY